MNSGSVIDCLGIFRGRYSFRYWITVPFKSILVLVSCAFVGQGEIVIIT